MRTAYFPEWMLPGQWEASGLRPGPTANPCHHQGQAFAQALPQTQAQAWSDVLAQQQAIYEELLASPDWAGQRKQPAPRPKRRSVRKLIRDLAGWGPAQPGALRAGKPAAE